MTLLVFAVYDQRVKAYMQPFFAQSKGSAMRSFIDCVNDPNHPLGKTYGDFVLFELGAWSDTSGIFEPLNVPAVVMTGYEAFISKTPLSHEAVPA